MDGRGARCVGVGAVCRPLDFLCSVRRPLGSRAPRLGRPGISACRSTTMIAIETRATRLVATLAIVVAASQAGIRGQDSTFASKAAPVRVDVLVTDNGVALTGLTAADFEVTDNGVVQQIELIEFDKLPLNVILALDMSASTTGERLLHLRLAARAVLGGLGPTDRA